MWDLERESKIENTSIYNGKRNFKYRGFYISSGIWQIGLFVFGFRAIKISLKMAQEKDGGLKCLDSSKYLTGVGIVLKFSA